MLLQMDWPPARFHKAVMNFFQFDKDMDWRGLACHLATSFA
jgi:hypothetical protein